MGNCLVTKLKGIVDNSKLKKLGKMRVVVSNASVLKFTKTVIATVLGGTYDGGNTIEFHEGWDIVLSGTIVSDGTYGEGKLCLEFDKYSVSKLNMVKDLDVEDLLYAENLDYLVVIGNLYNAYRLPSLFNRLTYLSLNYAIFDSEVDITGIGNSGAMTSIELPTDSRIIGTFDTIGKCLDLATLAVPGSKNVDFSVENFVGYRRAAGQANGSFSINWLGAMHSTFNGHEIPLQENNTISWTANTITCNGETIDA